MGGSEWSAQYEAQKTKAKSAMRPLIYNAVRDISANGLASARAAAQRLALPVGTIPCSIGAKTRLDAGAVETTIFCRTRARHGLKSRFFFVSGRLAAGAAIAYSAPARSQTAR